MESMFYDEVFDTKRDINEFSNGTENVITNALKNMFTSVKDAIVGRDLSPEDIEFMTKGVTKLRQDMADEFNKNIKDTVAGKYYKAKIVTEDTAKKAYNIFKSRSTDTNDKAAKGMYTIRLIDIYTDEFISISGLKDPIYVAVMDAAKKAEKIAKERMPRGFKLDYTFMEGDHSIIVIHSPKFRSNTVKAGNESFDIKFVENVISDEFLFKTNLTMSMFGLESASALGYQEMDDILNLINEEGGIENFVPVDMDFASYAECIGTEGITNFFARGWAKFRRVMHPLVKSDIKVSQTKFDQIKSTFEQSVTRSIPRLKEQILANRFLKFLYDNGALEINEKATNTFKNDSRMVASILVKFKSSKIKYDSDSGMLTVSGKKIDIMDLRNDEKWFQGNDADQVIYKAINDVIKAINKTVYKQIKQEHTLDKMGFSVQFLNDGLQSKVVPAGRTTAINYSTGDVYGAQSYDVEYKNNISSQINNKDILIGMVSRPLVVTGGTEALFSLDFDDMYEGGMEMDNTNAEIIINRMKAVNDTKEMVKKTPEYQRYAAGIEAEKSIDNASNTVETKELLGKIYDKFGMDGLKEILK